MRIDGHEAPDSTDLAGAEARRQGVGGRLPGRTPPARPGPQGGVRGAALGTEPGLAARLQRVRDPDGRHLADRRRAPTTGRSRARLARLTLRPIRDSNIPASRPVWAECGPRAAHHVTPPAPARHDFDVHQRVSRSGPLRASAAVAAFFEVARYPAAARRRHTGLRDPLHHPAAAPTRRHVRLRPRRESKVSPDLRRRRVSSGFPGAGRNPGVLTSSGGRGRRNG